MSGKFIYRDESGKDHDVTDDVGCLYDLVINSMDWGSGFLTVEDALPVVRIAQLGGYSSAERAQEYLNSQAHSIEQYNFLRQRDWADTPPEHEHVYSSAHKCMWSNCNAVEARK